MYSDDILDPINDIDRYIYHYTSTSTAIQYTLLQKQLRLSPIKNTNDPWEFNDNYFWLSNFSEVAGSGNSLDGQPDKQFFEWQREYAEQLKQSIMLSCFAKDQPHIDKQAFIQYRGFCRPRMWDHYANRHTGVCLIINRQKFLNRLEEQYGAKVHADDINYLDPEDMDEIRYKAHHVTYNQIQNTPVKELVNAIIDRNMKELFFCKSKDWFEENEYRILVQANQPVYVDLDGCLEGIVTGLKFNESDRRSLQIVQLRFESPVLSAKLRFHNGSYAAIRGDEIYSGEIFCGEAGGL